MSKHLKPLKIHSLTKLYSFKTKKLLALLKSARAIHSSILNHAGPRCCEICNEYVGDDYERDVTKRAEPFAVYILSIKTALIGREHVPSAAEKKKAMKERIKRGK